MADVAAQALGLHAAPCRKDDRRPTSGGTRAAAETSRRPGVIAYSYAVTDPESKRAILDRYLLGGSGDRPRAAVAPASSSSSSSSSPRHVVSSREEDPAPCFSPTEEEVYDEQRTASGGGALADDYERYCLRQQQQPRCNEQRNEPTRAGMHGGDGPLALPVLTKEGPRSRAGSAVEVGVQEEDEGGDVDDGDYVDVRDEEYLDYLRANHVAVDVARTEEGEVKLVVDAGATYHENFYEHGMVMVGRAPRRHD